MCDIIAFPYFEDYFFVSPFTQSEILNQFKEAIYR